MQPRAKYLLRPPTERGFTLIELMTVVAIVGVLAMLGLVAYKKFIQSSKTSEAIYMVGAIRSAQESYRAETLGYLDVTASFSKYYPKEVPNNQKTVWGDSANDGVRWIQLGARPDGPVYYGYKCAAGAAGGTIPAFSDLATPPTWPATTGPWYVILAKGDVDANGTASYVAGSSFTGEIYVENEGE